MRQRHDLVQTAAMVGFGHLRSWTGRYKRHPVSGSAQEYEVPAPPWPKVLGEAVLPRPRIIGVVLADVHAQAAVHGHPKTARRYARRCSCASHIAPCVG